VNSTTKESTFSCICKKKMIKVYNIDICMLSTNSKIIISVIANINYS